MAHYTLLLRSLAPVPVGHRVRIDIYERNWGVIGEEWKPDPRSSVVTDLETGIVWSSAEVFRDPDEFRMGKWRRFARSYWGTVTSCEVMSDCGDNVTIRTRLVVFPMEPPE